MLSTPILLITFNRPDHVRRVLESIGKIEPKSLYVFQDGPRDGSFNDIEKCAAVRHVVNEMVKWPCQIHTFYSDKNLGCGPGPASAISWFFKNEEQGIILEDDAVPHLDFYLFATVLLDKYKDNISVRAIGSMNVDTQRWGEGSYYFSMMNRNLCAWATWKRAWNDFDIRMSGVSRLNLCKALRKYRCGAIERDYWCNKLDEVHKDGCDGKSWDMQFFMSIWMHGGKGIIPNVNLCSNIGTVGEATHSMASGNIIDNVPTHPILPLKHPNSERIQFLADKQFHYLYFEPWKKNWNRFRIAYYLLNKRLKRLAHHEGPWIKKT